MNAFEKRRIGRTSLEVTALGLGCATLGGTRIPVTRREAEAIVRAAWDAGVRYVDAAPYYGFGQAERAVGDALCDEPRDEWVLSTKVGRLLRPFPQVPPEPGRRHPLPFGVAYDYSYDGIMRSFEDSLQRLGLARIDILYVHDIGKYQHGEAHPGLMRSLRESGYRALESLKGSGAISAIGLEGRSAAALFFDSTDDDVRRLVVPTVHYGDMRAFGRVAPRSYQDSEIMTDRPNPEGRST